MVTTATVKIILGISGNGKDELLSILINVCAEEAVTYCNMPEYDDKLDVAVMKMVIQSYNKLGTEGFNSQSFSGVSEGILDGYSNDIKTILNRYRLARFL